MWNKILIVLIIATFISTIFLIVQSGKNDNQTGTYVGYILMSFILVFPISLYLVGKYFVEYFNIVFISVFGFLVIFVAITLIIGLDIISPHKLALGYLMPYFQHLSQRL